MNPAISAMASSWRLMLPALCFCLAWILFWYWDTAVAMVTIWYRSETFAHAFLVPPISLWLIWRQRHALATLAPRPSGWVLLLMALSGFGWLLGELAAVNAVTMLSLVALLVLCVPALLGPRVAQAMMFPLAYLFFAVPIGEFVMPQMMEWTAEFTIRALELTGIPVYREGLHFVIPSGSWSVVEACSGVRYLIASVVVGTLYAYLTYRSLTRRLAFIAVSLVVPIVANWLRAYMIVMIGHLSGNKLAVGVDHLIYGWVFFGVVILLMFMIGARWAEHPDASATADGPRLGSSSAPSFVARTWPVMALLAVVTALPHVWLRFIDHMEAARGDASVSLTLQAAQGWATTESPAIQWRPAFTNPTAEFQTEFVRDEHRVGAFIGYYRQQNFDHKLVTSANVLVKSHDPEWKRVTAGARAITIGNAAFPVRTAELSGGGGTRLTVWQWYWINGYLTTSDYTAKALQAFLRLLGRGDDSAVVVLYAPKAQEAGLDEFVASHLMAIDEALRSMRVGR